MNIKITNDLFSTNNCLAKASISYKLTHKKFCAWFPVLAFSRNVTPASNNGRLCTVKPMNSDNPWSLLTGDRCSDMATETFLTLI